MTFRGWGVLAWIGVGVLAFALPWFWSNDLAKWAGFLWGVGSALLLGLYAIHDGFGISAITFKKYGDEKT